MDLTSVVPNYDLSKPHMTSADLLTPVSYFELSQKGGNAGHISGHLRSFMKHLFGHFWHLFGSPSFGGLVVFYP